MVALAFERAGKVPERGAADEGPTHGWKPSPRRLPAPVRVAELRAGDTAARPGGGELVEGPDRVRFRVGVGVRDHDELAARLGDGPVDVGAKATRPLVLDESPI